MPVHPILTDRTVARQKLAAILGEIDDFVATYDHQTANFGGASPVGMVHSDGTKNGVNARTEKHRFIITLLWRRDDDDATEDYLDGLALAVRQRLVGYDGRTDAWQDLQFDDQLEFSEMDYIVIDGQMFRREEIRVVVTPVLR